jgi:hypothetical protein
MSTLFKRTLVHPVIATLLFNITDLMYAVDHSQAGAVFALAFKLAAQLVLLIGWNSVRSTLPCRHERAVKE